MTKNSVMIGVMAILGAAASASATPTQVTNEQWLMPTQAVSDGCYYRATMQPDGNFMLSSNGTLTKYWSTGTAGRGGYARMQSDGNFVVNNWSDGTVWQTGTGGHPNAHARLQDDGSWVVEDTSNATLWTSYTGGEALHSSNCSGSNFAVTQMYFGWNGSGGDYSHFTLAQPRASWCAFYCSQDSRCKTFTFVPPGIQGAQAVCWLKDRPVTWYADSRMVSGVFFR